MFNLSKAASHLRAKQMVIALQQLPGVGWHAIDKAVRAELWETENWNEPLLTASGLNKGQICTILEAHQAGKWLEQQAVPKEFEFMNIKVITPYDRDYPIQLREIAQPPWVLYAIGKLELLHRPSVAIVGTRVPTAYGRHATRKLAQELTDGAVTVVSGMARGIDALAHETALLGVGGTIAVLPTAIHECYPRENRYLYTQISKEALLISETPFGTKLHPGQFHQRNRIIAALSAATIVVECTSKSGSLITARHAFEMNRELFAVPGPIHSPKSEGSNHLIRSGSARLISSAEQIFEELPWLQEAAQPLLEQSRVEQATVEQSTESWTKDEQTIVQLLQTESLTFDQILERTSIPFGLLNSVLLNLCIKQKIELHPGAVYTIL